MKKATLEITIENDKISFNLYQNGMEALEIIGAIEAFKIDFQKNKLSKKS